MNQVLGCPIAAAIAAGEITAYQPDIMKNQPVGIEPGYHAVVIDCHKSVGQPDLKAVKFYYEQCRRKCALNICGEKTTDLPNWVNSPPGKIQPGLTNGGIPDDQLKPVFGIDIDQQ